MSECCVKKEAAGLIDIQTKTEPITTRVWPLLLLVPVFVLIYLFLEKGTNYLVYSILSMDRNSHLTEAVRFFIFEVPKVLMLLTAIVFVVGIIRSYFSPEKTRKALEGKPLFLGNIMASSLGIVTPFCSCSAIPLFIGFMESGIPLGVTFSFLIAAPMINEVALVLLFGLFGWKTALLYASTGLLIAISAGWVIGKLKVERFVEAWVYEIKAAELTIEERETPFSERIQAGYTAVVGYRLEGLDLYRDRDCGRGGRPRLCAGKFHGLPDGQIRLVVRAAGGADRRAALFERGRDHPDHSGPPGEGGVARHVARVHDVGDRPVAAGDDHPEKGRQASPDPDFYRHRRLRDHGGRVSVQSDLLKGDETMEIKILGPGCVNCQKVEKLVREAVAEADVAADIEKVSDIMKIAKYGVFSTPAVVVDGKVKSVGKIPKKEEILAWLGK